MQIWISGTGINEGTSYLMLSVMSEVCGWVKIWCNVCLLVKPANQTKEESWARCRPAEREWDSPKSSPLCFLGSPAQMDRYEQATLPPPTTSKLPVTAKQAAEQDKHAGRVRGVLTMMREGVYVSSLKQLRPGQEGRGQTHNKFYGFLFPDCTPMRTVLIM